MKPWIVYFPSAVQCFLIFYNQKSVEKKNNAQTHTQTRVEETPAEQRAKIKTP